MRSFRGPRVDTTILGAATLFALAMGSGPAVTRFEMAHPPAATQGAAIDYAGVWLSPDGAVRLALGHDGTYDRSVQGRRQPASGVYRVTGTTVHLHDHSGLRTEVIYFEEALEMAGHRLYRD